jgi:hypothetical protein
MRGAEVVEMFKDDCSWTLKRILNPDDNNTTSALNEPLGLSQCHTTIILRNCEISVRLSFSIWARPVHDGAEFHC